MPRPKTAGPQRRAGWRTVTSLKPVAELVSTQAPSLVDTTDFNTKTHLTDMEYEAAIAQQQSVYAGPSIGPVRTGTPNGSGGSNRSSGENSRRNSPAISGNDKSTTATKSASTTTVKRAGGGRTWEDASLLEWDPAHFRLFVGNLSGEVTDEMLARAFQAFPSVSKVKVVRDGRTQLTRGYGFVAFKDPEDYFKAFKQMNNKYIGNHPVQLRKATTDVKPTTTGSKKNNNNGSASGNKSLHSNKHKKPKTRSTPYDRLA